MEGATDGAWPAVAPAISGLNEKLGGGGEVKGNPGVVLATGGLPNVPNPGGGLTVTFGVGCRRAPGMLRPEAPGQPGLTLGGTDGPDRAAKLGL